MRNVKWGMLLAAGLSVVLGGCAGGMSASSTHGTKKSPHGAPLRVGVILPLSGEFGVYGRASLDGVDCAAGQKSPCESRLNVQIVTRDDGGNPAKATTAVRELVEQEHVAAIIGPLMAKSTMAAAQEAQRLQVPLLSLSRLDGVAEVGPYTYRVALTPEAQVNTIARFAVQDRGYKKFAIVYPNNNFGQAFRDLFRTAVQTLGGEITVERAYSQNLAGIIEASKGVHNITDDDNKNKPRQKISTNGEVVDPATASSEPPPVPSFAKIRGVDAVFIPDSYPNLAAMFSAYSRNVFGGAALLGVNNWNSSGLLSAGSAVEGATFVDGFFRSSANKETQRFVSTFSQAYNSEPTLLEATAYDAMHIIALAAERGGVSAGKVQHGLQGLKKFNGVTGGLHFNSSGDVDRDLYVLTVSSGQIVEVGLRKSQLSRVLPTGAPQPLQRTARAPTNPKYDVGGDAGAFEAASPMAQKYGK